MNVRARIPEGGRADGPLGGHAYIRARLLFLLFAGLAVYYFGWLLQPERVGHRALFGALVAAELFNLCQALGFWWTCSHDSPKRRRGRDRAEDLLAPPRRAPIDAAGTTVDVLIPRYDEPADIVEPTVAAAKRLQGAQVRVYLLDDGRSPDMEELAARCGAFYLTRPDNEGAKAGNLNHALGRTDGGYVAVFDCDHVPAEDFLEKTLVDFDDPSVAYVQTPQLYANAPERGGVCAAAWAQQALFFGPIARGKDRLGAMFCCGTNMVFRRAALQDVGGFPQDSLTEDFEMSITLHERGWRSVYVPEVLARGLGPEDHASYAGQQHRWARGCLSALPKVLTARLPLRLRLQYLQSAMYFLTGFTVAIYITLPIVRLLTGAQPLAEATADQFLLHFAPYFGLAILGVSLFGYGRYKFDAFALMAANFWVHMRAAWGALARRPARFTVTPKKGAEKRQVRAVAPALAAIGALVVAAGIGLASDRSPATWNNVAFALLHTTVLLTAVWPALRKTRPAAAADPRVTDLPDERLPSPQPAPVVRVAEHPVFVPPDGGGRDAELVDELAGSIDRVLAEVLEPGGRCALLGYPNHANPGDAAIWLGAKIALARSGVDVVYESDRASFSPRAMRRQLNGGTILLHGGGNFGDLWQREQSFREDVIASFRRNRIVQLPQSINFRHRHTLEQARRIIGEHPGVVLLMRDRDSLDKAGSWFDADTRLCPDLALSLGRLERSRSPGAEVVWLARTDKEARTTGARSAREQGVVQVDWTRPERLTGVVPFVADGAARVLSRLAGRAARSAGRSLDPGLYDALAAANVRRGIGVLSHGRAVVTDRLHGHILGLLLGTPHVLLDDAYGKVRAFSETWTAREGAGLLTDPEEALEAARAWAAQEEEEEQWTRLP